MSLELKKPEVSLQPGQRFDQFPQRNLDIIKERHSEHERIPAHISPLKIIWTVLVASYFLVRSGLRTGGNR
ncbi:hypothetical protein [Arcticibacter sp.]|uniref:hypothetical protein n=1 Tax=Arcticibacter sp. TaxID=1872630 RepID=UPI00388DE45E